LKNAYDNISNKARDVMKSMKFKVINRKEWDTITQQFHRYQKEIEDATTFVQEIERGNLDADFVGEHFSGSGRLLMESMLRMRDEMKRLATEDKKRSWVNEGLASFVDTLRSQNDNLESLADNIIRHLVHYLKANQGALYLINDENPDDPYIAMEACYAYNRRKFLQQRIEIGEGLAGQVVLEKQTVYLKEVPENFVRITSGLGEALPRNILIVPLKLEEQVFGLIEIASFKMIEDFEIEFVEKLGESIASTISTVRNSERTNKLLQETQLQAEQMRAQEEEVRQNMEELSATQEEMQRILNEVQAQEAFVKGLIDASNDLIISIDREYKIISANKASIDSFKSSGIEVAPGLDMFKLISDEQREMFKGFYDRALGGEDFEVTENYSFGNKVQHVVLSFSPLRNEKAEVIGVVEFTKDISALVEATNEAERLLKASQEDAEELKAQEEELRQNLEEMNTLQEEMSSQVKEIESLKNDLEIREGVFGLTTILSEADLTGNITLANKKLCEVSKYSNEELVGMPHSLLRHPDMPKELFKLFWQTIKRGEVFKGIIKNRAKDGTHYWVDATIVPVKDENGQITKYVGARYHLTNDEMAKEMYNAQAKKLGHPLLP
jgi:PAS domain S-box-containing protein